MKFACEFKIMAFGTSNLMNFRKPHVCKGEIKVFQAHFDSFRPNPLKF